MHKVDHDKIADLLRECAEEYIVPRFEALQDHEINSKSNPNDLVTQADLDVESRLAEVLSKDYPGSFIVGEENVFEDEASLKPLKSSEGMVWVVDPVDGTFNFVHGRREFAVILACVIDGQTRYGWIYDVLGNTMTIAEKGAGVHMEGQALHVSEPVRMEETVGHIGMKYFSREMRGRIKEQQDKVGNFFTLSCCAHEYLRVVSGRSDFAVYSRVKPWDHLAGCLAVQEAGGSVTHWDGSSYEPGDFGRGLVVAANDRLLEYIRRSFIGG